MDDVDDSVSGSIWGPLSLPPPRTPPAAGHCQLWPVPIGDADGFRPLLTPDELERTERFKVASARDTFLTSRAAQRLVLAWYLGCSPHEVRIARDCLLCADRGAERGEEGGRGEHGRPHVVGADVDFSVSHAAGWLLIAVVGDGRVGVDVESVTATRSVEELADRVLSPAEQQMFLVVPREERPAWFLHAWTRKEAAVKLTGHGLIATLSHLDASGPELAASPPPDQWPADPIYLLDVPSDQSMLAALASTTPVAHVELCGPLPAGNAPGPAAF